MQNTSNTDSSTPQLLPELFREIFEHLEDDKLSLCAVSLSSTILRHETQSILFRNVTMVTKESAHLKFLYTVAASPSRLALLVRAYSILTTDISQELCARIREALQAMCNLNYLCVYCMGQMTVQSSDGPAAVLRGCTFKLERFHWMSDPSEAPELIETFLRGQDKLRYMSITFLHAASPERIRPVKLTTRICPQLASLAANWDVIKDLLPGKNISPLKILRSFIRPSTKIDINTLALSLKNIRSLSYDFNSQYEEEPPPELVLPHCTSLAALEIRIFTEEKIFAVLPKLPPLHTLVLSRNYYSGRTLPQETAELVRRILENSGLNLQKVYVQIDPMTYERYMPSQKEGDPILRVNQSEGKGLFAE